MKQLFKRLNSRKKSRKAQQNQESATDISEPQKRQQLPATNNDILKPKKDRWRRWLFSNSKNSKPAVDVITTAISDEDDVKVFHTPKINNKTDNEKATHNKDREHASNGEDSDNDHQNTSGITIATSCSSNCSAFSHLPQHYDAVTDSHNEDEKDSTPKVELERYVKEENDPIVMKILQKSLQDILNTSHRELTVEQRNKVSLAVSALDKSGNEFFEKGMYDEAFKRYERALKLKRKTLKENVNVLKGGETNDFQTISDQQQQQLDVINAVVSGEQPKVTQIDENTKNILASVATSINNMTYLKQRSGQASAQETMASYLKALQIKREILGPNHLSVGKTLNNIGSVFYLQKDYDQALAAYEDAYRIMQHALGDAHLDVGTVLSNLGDVYCCKCDRILAIEYYNRALDVRWDALGPFDPKVIRLLEQMATLELKLMNGGLTQPINSDCSDSEDEEFLEEDRQKQIKYLSEVNSLKKEVQDDLDFMDWMESQASISFLEDRAEVYQEIRDLYDSTHEEDLDPLEIIELANNELEARNDTLGREEPQTTRSRLLDSKKQERKESSGIEESISSDVSIQISAQIEENVGYPTDEDDETGGGEKNKGESIPSEKPSITNKDDDRKATTKGEEEHTVDAADFVDHPTLQTDFALVVQSVSNSTMDAEERERRLAVVRERLSIVRSNREYQRRASTTPMTHRSFMDSTACSKARCRSVFLGGKEVHNIKQGISALQRSSLSQCSDHSNTSTSTSNLYKENIKSVARKKSLAPAIDENKPDDSICKRPHPRTCAV